MASSDDFQTIPILNWRLLSSDRSRFLSELQHALIYVGFLYLEDPPVSKVRCWTHSTHAVRLTNCTGTHSIGKGVRASII